jgi:uncharacterized membrane protein HdeD (DUF308 family)
MWLLADASSHTFYRFARLQAMSEWWHWLVLLGLCAALAAYVVVMYYYDSVELSRGVAWTLVALRLLAFGGILFFFMDLEKRTERRETKHSRAILLVDTSQSMGLRDAERESGSGDASRMERIIDEFRSGDLVKQLREQHDVVVYKFSEQAEPQQMAFFEKFSTVASAGAGMTEAVAELDQSLRTARRTSIAAGSLVSIALLSILFYLFFGRQPRGGENLSLALLIGMVMLVAGVVVFAVANLRAPGIPWRAIVGLEQPDFAAQVQAELVQSPTDGDGGEQTDTVEPDEIQWQQQLVPRGMETRIGDAVRFVVNKERGGPIAGIVLISDGGNNGGIDVKAAPQLAQVAAIPIHAIGMGCDRRPVNARIVDLEAPKRVYPGDKFTMTGFVQAYGLEGRLVKVELLSSTPTTTGDGADPSKEPTFEEEQSLRLVKDGEVQTVKFEATPGEAGLKQYLLRVVAPDEDIEPRDNEKTAQVQVVERKTRVLLMAGGPTREFRFLRNQLYRDRDTSLDVLLQSGSAGMSQEADNVLDEFPQLADELFEYDCIIAFDPDWMALDAFQVKLLDRWVAEMAGGLIVVAGPVFTPEWSSFRRGRDDRVDTIKGLYPVVYYTQGAPNLSLGRFGGEAAWPLEFTRDGLEAEFLWLEDDPLDSEATWSSFAGVYGYYAVKDPKPGARVYARFSNPETAIDDELPIYLAGHLYGAGRVFFQASGEMWRVRAVDERYFESYYTKLIRWVSQGRLLRDSSRGVLLVDKDRCLLGEQITVRAILNDAQHQPLTEDEVSAALLQPDGSRTTIVLKRVREAARDGMYETQFTALQEGDYRIELTPPLSTDEELLTTEVRVRVPALEMEQPQRNDPLLKEFADQTRAEYYIGFDAAMRRGSVTRASLPSVLEPNEQVVYLPEALDSSFEQQLMGWLIVLICGVLCLEWLLRRVSKLACFAHRSTGDDGDRSKKIQVTRRPCPAHTPNPHWTASTCREYNSAA